MDAIRKVVLSLRGIPGNGMTKQSFHTLIAPEFLPRCEIHARVESSLFLRPGVEPQDDRGVKMKTLNISKLLSLISMILFYPIYKPSLAQQPQIPEEILSYSVFIEVKENGTGTGSFMHYNQYCYLVTAQHVIYNQYKDENDVYIPKDSILTIASYPRDPHKSDLNIRYVVGEVVTTGDLVKEVKEGSFVYFDKVAGSELRIKGNRYKAIRERDVVVFLEDADTVI